MTARQSVRYLREGKCPEVVIGFMVALSSGTELLPHQMLFHLASKAMKAQNEIQALEAMYRREATDNEQH